MHKATIFTSSLALALVGPMTAGAASAAAVEYDQDVTNNVIFGTGNANGGWTTVRLNGVELGLRAKLRHNASGAPENTFNSNGDGTYNFSTGVAPTQASPTAEWSFEWSINTNYDGSRVYGYLGDFTYELSMTSTNGATIATFDPINDSDNGTLYWDHAFGTNSTGSGDGAVAVNSTEYNDLVPENNLAQNSWKPHWFAADFDPNAAGTYTFTLSATDRDGLIPSQDEDEKVQLSTTIDVNVPEPSSALLLAASGLALMSRRRRKLA